MYQKLMLEKKFSFKELKSCDDALTDTIHDRYQCYVESEERTDSTLTINFKFKDACCQSFLGDYHVSNDTLYFEFEQVNDVVCSCVCFYHYGLQLSSINQDIEYTQLIMK